MFGVVIMRSAIMLIVVTFNNITLNKCHFANAVILSTHEEEGKRLTCSETCCSRSTSSMCCNVSCISAWFRFALFFSFFFLDLDILALWSQGYKTFFSSVADQEWCLSLARLFSLVD